jgi:hypothetical protein
MSYFECECCHSRAEKEDKEEEEKKEEDDVGEAEEAAM